MKTEELKYINGKFRKLLEGEWPKMPEVKKMSEVDGGCDPEYRYQLEYKWKFYETTLQSCIERSVVVEDTDKVYELIHGGIMRRVPPPLNSEVVYHGRLIEGQSYFLPEGWEVENGRVVKKTLTKLFEQSSLFKKKEVQGDSVDVNLESWRAGYQDAAEIFDGIIAKDSARLNWLESVMTNDDNYIEVYFAGLRDFKSGKANSYQIESGPWEAFQSINASTLREAIDKAMEKYTITKKP